MIIFTILIAGVILFGSLIMYAFGAYTEHKGYMRWLEEAEEIVKEVREYEED